ncbi:hypothetical protein CRYUN_Cryun09bG0059100 [Craigia yunnanensis]
MKSLEEDPMLLDESLSLKNFGLSDVCLATLASQAEEENDLNPVEAPRPLIQVSKDGYESLPSYMTSLASWEDLLAAVVTGQNFTRPKGRAYLQLLVRMNLLVVETIDGMISYRVL